MRKFIYKLLLFLTIITTGLQLLYYYFDPNDNTIGDYRYVKTRRVYKSPEPFNTLVIGSSRVINIGDTIAGHNKIFNYGLLGGMPEEYASYISFALKNQPIENVIVALDFYGGSINGLKGLNDFGVVLRTPEEYIHEVKSETNLSVLLSRFEFPRFKRLINSMLFDQDFIIKQPDEDGWIRKQWGIYQHAYSDYEADPDLINKYARIKSACKGTRLRVYITPISKPLFELLQEKNLEEEYERFLKKAVSSFDTVYNFMELNEMTRDPKNFIDENHTTNEKLYEIIQYINENTSPTERHIGTLLTPFNIEEYLDNNRYIRP